MMISYAQNFEDVILARVFKDRCPGFYVDVGAGDPVHLSVTKWLYDLGWNGINIEPNRALFQELIAQRLRDINLPIAAGAARGKLTFYEAEVGELSSFNAAACKGVSKVKSKRIVQVHPLDDILHKYVPEREIDFLKIDVEGWEQEVL